MLIDSISVHSFRSINHAEIPIGEITALVGENNAGKSALLRAINSFFNFAEEKEAFISGKHAYSNHSKPKIEISFKDIPAGDPILAPLIQNNSIHIEFSCQNNTDKATYRYKSNNRYVSLDQQTFDAIKKHIDFILIPPTRDLNKLKWTEDALLKKLVDNFLFNETDKRDVLSPPFIKAARNLERTALSKIAKRIQQYYSSRKSYQFSIKYLQNVTYSSFLNDIQFLLIEKTGRFDLVDCGTGVQSLSIIAMYRVLSELQGKKIIIGLEEPETNLHPQAQREFIKDLSSRMGTDNCCQVLFTTHSTVLIDQLGHEQIILFRKVEDPHRPCGFKTEVSYITETFWSKYGLDDFKYYQFHRYKNSEMFFAKFVIIVESKSEAQVIHQIVSDEKALISEAGISIVNLDGVDNIKYPYFLLRDLKIPFLTIIDKDHFLQYQNDTVASSRDSRGFPKYKNEYDADCLVDEMIPTHKERDLLLTYLKDNHTRALDLLEKHNVICMRWNLETDLVSSQKATELYCQLFKKPFNMGSQKDLLMNNPTAIKKINTILSVLKDLPQRNFPLSYSRIRRYVLQKIREL